MAGFEVSTEVTTSTPNPETDTGSGQAQPKVLGDTKPPKSPAEIEAERKRQVTVPSDDQSRPQGRIFVPADDPQKAITKQRTDGRIQPAEGDSTGSGGATVYGAGRLETKPGSGLEQVGGARSSAAAPESRRGGR